MTYSQPWVRLPNGFSLPIYPCYYKVTILFYKRIFFLIFRMKQTNLIYCWIGYFPPDSLALSEKFSSSVVSILCFKEKRQNYYVESDNIFLIPEPGNSQNNCIIESMPISMRVLLVASWKDYFFKTDAQYHLQWVLHK